MQDMIGQKQHYSNIIYQAIYSCIVFDNYYQAQYKRILSNAWLTDSCRATEAERLLLIRITVSICQRFFLLMHSKSYQEQNLSTNTITLHSQILNTATVFTHFIKQNKSDYTKLGWLNIINIIINAFFNHIITNQIQLLTDILN